MYHDKKTGLWLPEPRNVCSMRNNQGTGAGTSAGTGGALTGGAGGAAAPTFTFEWKVTGGSYVEMADEDTLTPTNLSGKQLILAITPSAEVELETVATSRPNLLAEDGDNTGTLTASTQNEVAFDMATDQLAGIVVVTLTIDGTDYTFTFHCFQYAGSLRAINSGASATTGIVVDGVDIGDAAAGYASLYDASAASSDDDVIVATGAVADSTAVTITADVFVDVADSCRAGVAYDEIANGYYLSAQVTLQSLSIVIRHVGFFAGGGASTALLATDDPAGDGATYIIESCPFYKISNFQCFATLSTSGYNVHATIRNCVMYCAFSTSGIVLNGDANTIVAENCTVFGLSNSPKGIWNNSSSGVLVAKNCVVLGSFTSNDYVTNGGSLNTGDNNVGNTSGNVAAACATTSYTTTAAAYFADTTGGTEDAHCVSAAVNDDFAGVDLSANFDLDVDGELRTAWYAGADFVAA